MGRSKEYKMKNSYEFSLYYSTFKSGIPLRRFSKQSYPQPSIPNYLKTVNEDNDR